jgi:hypothetical protein
MGAPPPHPENKQTQNEATPELHYDNEEYTQSIKIAPDYLLFSFFERIC